MGAAETPEKVSAARLYFTFLPFMAEQIGNGGGKRAPGEFIIGSLVPGYDPDTVTTLNQGNFTFWNSEAGEDQTHSLWINNPPAGSGYSYVWTATKSGGSSVTFSTQNTWIAFTQIANKFNSSLNEWQGYLSPDTYSFTCDVQNASGKSVGNTGNAIIFQVPAFSYNFVLKDGSTTITNTTTITKNPGDTINLRASDNYYDSLWLLSRTFYFNAWESSYNYSIFDGVNADANDYKTNGQAFPVVIPATAPAGTYYAYVQGSAYNPSMTNAVDNYSDNFTISVTAAATIGTTLPAAQVNGSNIEIYSGAFDDGTDNYTLSLSGAPTAASSYQWYVLYGGEWVALSFTADEFDFIDVNEQLGGTTSSELPAGNYKFYCVLFDSSNEPIGTTGIVSVAVYAGKIDTTLPVAQVSGSNLTIVQGFFTDGTDAYNLSANTSGLTFAGTASYQWYYSYNSDWGWQPIFGDVNEIDFIDVMDELYPVYDTNTPPNKVPTPRYPPVGTYYIYCEIGDSDGTDVTFIGNTNIVTVQVQSFGYEIEITDIEVASSSVTVAASITINANEEIVLTVNDNANDSDTFLPRSYTWYVLDATNLNIGNSGPTPITVTTNGEITITIDTSNATGLDLQSGETYTVYITGSVSATNVYTPADTINLEIEVN